MMKIKLLLQNFNHLFCCSQNSAAFVVLNHIYVQEVQPYCCHMQLHVIKMLQSDYCFQANYASRITDLYHA